MLSVKTDKIKLKNKENIFQNLILWILSFVSSVLFLLFYSTATSPLTSYYGEDSAFYAMVGAAMKHGMLPYRDFYEMKGPYMFWIEYFGQLISEGRFGTFCIQTINMTLTIGIILCIVNLLLKKMTIKKIQRFVIYICSVLFSLLIISFTFEGGNLTEEFSYPVMVLCLYLCLRYFDDQDCSPVSDHSLKIGFIYGMAFGFFAFVRIINAAFLGAVLLTIVIYLISKKNWKNILQNAVVFIAGVIVAMLPACIWALTQGILKDMIRQVFVLAFSYSTELNMADRFMLVKNFVWPMIVIGMVSIFLYFTGSKKKWPLLLLSVSSAVILLIAVSMGDGYLHYFSLQLPNAVLALYFLISACLENCETDINDSSYCRESVQENNLSNIQKETQEKNLGNTKKEPQKNDEENVLEKIEKDNQDNSDKNKTLHIIRIVLSVCIVILAICMQKDVIRDKTLAGANYTIQSVRQGNPDEGDVAYIQDVMGQIPDDEKDSVYLYGFGSCSQWYAKAGIFPPNKYCDWQPHWIILYPEIKAELLDYIGSHSAKWIVLPNGGEIWPDEIKNSIYENYTEFFVNDYYILLHEKVE